MVPVARSLVLVLVLTVTAIAGCAPRQQLAVEPRLPVGTTLRYGFDASVVTTLAQREERTIRSTLAGTVELEVLGDGEDGTQLSILFTPTSSSRDGRSTEPGPSQRRDVTLRPDGSVAVPDAQDPTLGDADLQPELLSTVLHPAVPTPLEGPGAAWRDGSGSGRLIALDRSDGRDLAELLLLRELTVQRQRMLDGRPVDLGGTERTSTTMLWDLDAGIPVRADLRSNAELEVRAGALVGGTITIEARTLVTLLP